MTNPNEGKSVLLTDAVTDYFDKHVKASERELAARQFMEENMDMILDEVEEEDRLLNTPEHELTSEDLSKKQDLLKPR